MEKCDCGLLVFIIGALIICCIMLVCGFCLGGRSRYKIENKDVPFESGIDSVGGAKLRFSIRFYLVAMCFVIFDTESIYLYIWSVVVREIGWIGLVEMMIFSLTLLVGLIYLIRLGIFDYNKKQI